MGGGELGSGGGEAVMLCRADVLSSEFSSMIGCPFLLLEMTGSSCDMTS